MKYKAFKDLPMWVLSSSLINLIYDCTKQFPKEETFNLVSQLRRASVSIAGNIAESWGRYYYADKARILAIARGEIEEIRSHLAIANNLGFINKKDYRFLEDEYSQLLNDLNKHRKSLMNKNINF